MEKAPSSRLPSARADQSWPIWSRFKPTKKKLRIGLKSSFNVSNAYAWTLTGSFSEKKSTRLTRTSVNIWPYPIHEIPRPTSQTDRPRSLSSSRREPRPLTGQDHRRAVPHLLSETLRWTESTSFSSVVNPLIIPSFPRPLSVPFLLS